LLCDGGVWTRSGSRLEPGVFFSYGTSQFGLISEFASLSSHHDQCICNESESSMSVISD
jgi:hypothetical protein